MGSRNPRPGRPLGRPLPAFAIVHMLTYHAGVHKLLPFPLHRFLFLHLRVPEWIPHNSASRGLLRPLLPSSIATAMATAGRLRFFSSCSSQALRTPQHKDELADNISTRPTVDIQPLSGFAAFALASRPHHGRAALPHVWRTTQRCGCLL